MALIDDLKVKAVELTQAGVAKSKQLTEIARLQLANAGENRDQDFTEDRFRQLINKK